MAKPPPIYFQPTISYKIPEEISAEVGLIIVRWAYLEYAVQRIIWILMQVTVPLGRLAIREPRLEDRIRLLKDLADLREVEVDEKAILGLVSQTQEIRKSRDLLAHGSWFFNKTSNGWSVVLTRGKWSDDEPHPSSKTLVPEALAVTPEALRTIINQMDFLIAIVQRLAEEVEGQIEPPPEVPPSQLPRKRPKRGQGPSGP